MVDMLLLGLGHGRRIHTDVSRHVINQNLEHGGDVRPKGMTRYSVSSRGNESSFPLVALLHPDQMIGIQRSSLIKMVAPWSNSKAEKMRRSR